MKKLASILLALTLCLTLTAALAETTTYTASTYYTVEYPSEMQLDDTSYTSENTDTYTWLFMLNSDTIVIDASMEQVEEYAGFSLFNATDEEKQAYLEEVADSYADYNCEYVDMFETTANQIPFYVFRMEDSDGPYYYVETIANGTSLYFCVSNIDGTEPDETLLSEATAVLQTLTPLV